MSKGPVTLINVFTVEPAKQDYQAMRGDSAALPYLQQALAIARFEPGMYEVVQDFCPGCTDA